MFLSGDVIAQLSKIYEVATADPSDCDLQSVGDAISIRPFPAASRRVEVRQHIGHLSAATPVVTKFREWIVCGCLDRSKRESLHGSLCHREFKRGRQRKTVLASVGVGGGPSE